MNTTTTAQDILSDSEESYRLLSEATQEGVLIHEDGTVLQANQVLADMFGRDHAALIGMDVFDFFTEESAEVAKERVASGQSGSYEATGQRADGSTFHMEVSAKLVDSNGHHLRVVAMRDITDRKETEEQIRSQSEAIMEMSTPVIQVWEGVLLIPLIGTVDTARAQQITERLLEAVVRYESEVAIIDVTGVPEIDTSVARHLLQAIDASRMLGAEAILTGFSPTAAQTLAQLGVDFSALRTRGSLRAGMIEAFSMVGQKLG